MPNSSLLKIAMVDGVQLQTLEQPCAGFAEKLLEIKCLSFSGYIAKALMTRDHVFLRLRMWQIYIVHHQKEATQSALYNNSQLSSLALYKTLQPECKFPSVNACLVDG